MYFKFLHHVLVQLINETKILGWISLFAVFISWQVGADNREILDQIIDSLTSLANHSGNYSPSSGNNLISLKVGMIQESIIKKKSDTKMKRAVLIIGAGRVCRPAAELLASIGSTSSGQWFKTCLETDFEDKNGVEVLVASLYLKDAEEV